MTKTTNCSHTHRANEIQSEREQQQKKKTEVATKWTAKKWKAERQWHSVKRNKSNEDREKIYGIEERKVTDCRFEK